MEKFAFLMRERRDEVVRLLMWEIGKTLPDSEKEFDRTLQYIRDTIDALKELDRASSRFTIAEGILGADPARAARRGALHGARSTTR